MELDAPSFQGSVIQVERKKYERRRRLNIRSDEHRSNVRFDLMRFDLSKALPHNDWKPPGIHAPRSDHNNAPIENRSWSIAP